MCFVRLPITTKTATKDNTNKIIRIALFLLLIQSSEFYAEGACWPILHNIAPMASGQRPQPGPNWSGLRRFCGGFYLLRVSRYRLTNTPAAKMTIIMRVEKTTVHVTEIWGAVLNSDFSGKLTSAPRRVPAVQNIWENALRKRLRLPSSTRRNCHR